jgi:hypothetical protein
VEIHGLYSTDFSSGDCTRKDSRRSRTVWGFELGRCYDFDQMPDTDCREYIGTKEQGGCSGTLSPQSVIVPDEGYNCLFYVDDDCKRPLGRLSDHSCMLTNMPDIGWVGNQIGSFRCVSTLLPPFAYHFELTIFKVARIQVMISFKNLSTGGYCGLLRANKRFTELPS